MIRPNKPRMAAKISIVRILTNLNESMRVLEEVSNRVYSQGGVCCIGQRCATSIDAYTNTADQVAHADSQAGPEQGISGEDVRCCVDLFNVVELIQFRGEDDGHDDAVDSDNLTENDRDQVLRSYPGCLDTSSNDGDASGPDSPVIVSDPQCLSHMRSHTMLSRRRRDRCIVRCPNWRKCTAIRFRETVRPGEESVLRTIEIV
jgi:hypothetical protein